MSHGKAVVAMIINGPWFYGQSLHRFSRFFANNPLERLIRDGIAFEHINDNFNIMVLDGFFDPKVSKVYFEWAIKVKSLTRYHPCRTVLQDMLEG